VDIFGRHVASSQATRQKVSPPKRTDDVSKGRGDGSEGVNEEGRGLERGPECVDSASCQLQGCESVGFWVIEKESDALSGASNFNF
jgi:hypothetical protein